MRPTDSIATSNAYPLERDSMPLRTFQQLDAQPVTHSFTDEFLQRWRDIIVTARQNGAPPAPQEGPTDLASDPDASPWGAARISRTQVLRPLRLGWNTIWRRHQRHGADPHHEGDPLDHLELHLIPHLTLEDIFELIFAYWPDLRPDNQWFLSTADDSIQYAQRARPWRGELFFLNSILDGRPGHQIVAFELPAPQPLVLRYVPEASTYWEIRHHLQAIHDEHILLNGIPWTERDNMSYLMVIFYAQNCYEMMRALWAMMLQSILESPDRLHSTTQSSVLVDNHADRHRRSLSRGSTSAPTNPG